MAQHYDLNNALYAIGMKHRWQRFLYLYLHRKDFTEANVKYGIGLERLVEIVDGLTPFERRLYGVKAKRKQS